VIAFVVNEMKRLGKITSIPLEGHHDLLALLNETIGGSAGSSETETLLSRIYRNGNMPSPTLKRPHFSWFLEGKRDMKKGSAKPMRLPRLKKIAGQIFLSTRGA